MVRETKLQKHPLIRWLWFIARDPVSRGFQAALSPRFHFEDSASAINALRHQQQLLLHAPISIRQQKLITMPIEAQKTDWWVTPRLVPERSAEGRSTRGMKILESFRRSLKNELWSTSMCVRSSISLHVRTSLLWWTHRDPRKRNEKVKKLQFRDSFSWNSSSCICWLQNCEDSFA